MLQKILGLFGWTVVRRKDFEELKKLAEKLKILSIIDSLTGLYNRRGFMEFLTKEISQSQRHGRIFSLVFVDIDYLKRVNDSYGHDAGDKALKTIADIMKQFLREEDISARYGGDEFAILLPETDRKIAMDIVQRVRKEIEQTVLMYGENKSRLTVSCGLVCFNPLEDDIISLLNRADKAMYNAKDGGRNRVSACV